MPHNKRECAAILLDIIDPHEDRREGYTPYGDDEATRNRVTSNTVLLTQGNIDALDHKHGIGLFELYYHGFLTKKPPSTEEQAELTKTGKPIPVQYVDFDELMVYADKFERLDKGGLIRT
jgi:hypothetical protein